MRKSTATLLFVIVALTPSLSQATLCTLDDTQVQCLRRLDKNAMPRDTATQAIEERVDNEMATANTGTVSMNAGGTVVSDLSSLLAFALDTESLGDDRQAVTVDLNRILGLPGSGDYQLRGIIRQAEVFAPLNQALGTDGEASMRRDELDDELGDFDDVSLMFSYSLNTKRLGRSTEGKDFLNEIFAQAATPSVVNCATPPDIVVQNEILPVLAQRNIDPSSVFVTNTTDLLPDATFRDVAQAASSALATRLIEAVECQRQSIHQQKVRLDQALERIHFDEIADLVANQPQLVFSVERTERDRLTGPSETKGKLTFEKGWNNVNTVRQACAGNVTLQCVKNAIDQNRKAIDRKSRLKLSLEYADIESYDESFFGGTINVDQGSDRKLTATLGYGQVLRTDGAGNDATRLDLTWSYEDVDNDSMRQTRSVLNASFSQQVAGGFVLTLGAVYANKPEFLGQVDEEVSARFGLTYKLAKKPTLGQ